MAHKVALEYGGKTIAVLPSGFNSIYPKENIDIARKIVENNGLLITEYENNIKASSDRFLERNRIVVGLSKGVLVIEAAYRSGTSVTAKIALKNSKKVFAIPR